ncbi:MFS transporter [Rhodococcus sp. NPDC057014]|uniref:MFS transporter n=1 Tax=Rhodococcus sp. NPDC057014 TaxID=3346000 RepID=UPI003639D14B
MDNFSHGPTGLDDQAASTPTLATCPTVQAEPRHRWLALVVICVGTMMAFVNVSSTIGALSSIQSDLGSSSTQVVWVTSAYSLIVASLVLGSGTLGDLLGRQRVFSGGATVFAIGSVLAFAANSTSILIAAQAIMGTGGALVLPTGLAIISHTFTDQHERTEAISIWAASSGLGLAVGPLGAGTLLESFSWHSVYLINAVLGAVTLLGSIIFVPNGKNSGRHLDPVGIALGTATVASLTYAVIEGGSSGYGSGRLIVVYAALAVALVGFIIWESRHHDPMLDVALFKSTSFSAIMGAAAMALFGFTGTSLLVVLYLQHVQDVSALGAGLRLLVMFVAYILFSAVAGRVVKRVGFKLMLIVGMIVMAAGIFALLASPAESEFERVWPGLLLVGIGGGLLVAPSTAAAVNSVGHQQAGMASGAVNMFRQVGNVLGASVLGTILTTNFVTNLRDRLNDAELPESVATSIVDSASRGGGGDQLPAPLASITEIAIKNAFTDAVHLSLLVAGIVLVIAVIPIAAFVHDRPTQSN